MNFIRKYIGLRSALLALTTLAVPLGAAHAQDDDLAKKIVNASAPAALNVYNLTPPPKLIGDPKVQGGKALRVAIPKAGEHPWSITLASSVTKPMKAGDKVVVAFFARAEQGDNGTATVSLPAIDLQLATEPYTSIFSGSTDIGAEWKMYQISGKLDRDYPAGALNASIQLATTKHVIDFGPLIILDMGRPAS